MCRTWVFFVTPFKVTVTNGSQRPTFSMTGKAHASQTSTDNFCWSWSWSNSKEIYTRDQITCLVLSSTEILIRTSADKENVMTRNFPGRYVSVLFTWSLIFAWDVISSKFTSGISSIITEWIETDVTGEEISSLFSCDLSCLSSLGSWYQEIKFSGLQDWNRCSTTVWNDLHQWHKYVFTFMQPRQKHCWEKATSMGWYRFLMFHTMTVWSKDAVNRQWVWRTSAQQIFETCRSCETKPCNTFPWPKRMFCDQGKVFL